LVLARSTIIVPLYNRVIFVRLLDGSEFSSRLSKISQTHDTISGIQFRVGRGAERAPASWLGRHQQLLQYVTEAVEGLCGVWVSAYW
jgi:hypothetical protein